jgi:ankyrin repeat protein
MNIFKSFIIFLLLFSFSMSLCVKRKKQKCTAKANERAFNSARKKIEKAILEGDSLSAAQLLNWYGSALAHAYHSNQGLHHWTLAAYANGQNKPAILRLFLKAGASPIDSTGKSLLFHAIQYTQTECVQVLLADGYADPNAIMICPQQNYKYCTPLHLNAYNLIFSGNARAEKLKIAHALLDHGADRWLKDGNGKTVIEILDEQPEEEIAAQLTQFLLTYNPKKKIA